MRFFLDIRQALKALLANMAAAWREKVTEDCKRFDVDSVQSSVYWHFEGQAKRDETELLNPLSR
jgi:hypothetical protein